LGSDYFHYDEKAHVLTGERSGESYAMGQIVRLRLAEANPLTGALKFEPEHSDGAIEPRGKPLPSPLKKRGKHMTGKRGRPGNIRHQGRRK
ncbi:MAG TPA: ribonuclease R, partial [Novosphingobium sp.]|nr:ribonuclease R [Novosphingobium sp.]